MCFRDKGYLVSEIDKRCYLAFKACLNEADPALAFRLSVLLFVRSERAISPVVMMRDRDRQRAGSNGDCDRRKASEYQAIVAMESASLETAGRVWSGSLSKLVEASVL